MEKQLSRSAGYLVDMITRYGKRYHYGVRKSYLRTFIDCAFEHGCTVEFIDFCKMPKNTGIMVVSEDDE